MSNERNERKEEDDHNNNNNNNVKKGTPSVSSSRECDEQRVIKSKEHFDKKRQKSG